MGTTEYTNLYRERASGYGTVMGTTVVTIVVTIVVTVYGDSYASYITG